MTMQVYGLVSGQSNSIVVTQRHSAVDLQITVRNTKLSLDNWTIKYLSKSELNNEHYVTFTAISIDRLAVRTWLKTTFVGLQIRMNKILITNVIETRITVLCGEKNYHILLVALEVFP